MVEIWKKACHDTRRMLAVLELHNREEDKALLNSLSLLPAGNIDDGLSRTRS